MSAKKELSKIYVLKKADTEVLSFRFQTDFWQTSVLIDDVYRPEMLPFYIQNRGITPESLFKWIRRRLIPEHRIYAGRLLEKLHTDIRDIEGILKISYGLSLNDDYWIVPESQNVSFNKYNLFDNPFSEVIATLAISGNGPQLEHKFYPSPEFTTGGMLPKCWKRTGSLLPLVCPWRNRPSRLFGWRKCCNVCRQVRESFSTNFISRTSQNGMSA